MKFSPSPLKATSDLEAQRAAVGWAVLDAAAMIGLCGLPATALGGLQSVQQGLPLDTRQPAWHDALVLTLRRGGFPGSVQDTRPPGTIPPPNREPER